MIYSLHLYVAKPERAGFLVDSLKFGGFYHQLCSRMFRGYIATDVLRNRLEPTEILTLTFWTDSDACSAAQASHNYRALSRFFSRLTLATVNLGEYFTLPERLIPRTPGADIRGTVEHPVRIDMDAPHHGGTMGEDPPAKL